MKNLLVSITLCFSLTCAAATVKSVGYFQLIPHSSFMDGGKDEGVALQYFRQIAQKMQLGEFKFQALPLIRLISMMAQNEVDIALYLGKNETRSKLLQYASTPLFMMRPSVIVKKGRYTTSELNADNVKQMNICVWKEGYHSPLITTHAKEITEMTGMNISTRCIGMVKRGRLDAFYSPDHLTLHYEILLSKLEDQLEVIALEGPEIGLFTTFSPKTAPEFIQRFDQALQQLSSEVSYMDFYQQQLKLHLKTE